MNTGKYKHLAAFKNTMVVSPGNPRETSSNKQNKNKFMKLYELEHAYEVCCIS